MAELPASPRDHRLRALPRASAREVLDIEADAVRALRPAWARASSRAAPHDRRAGRTKGRVVVTGIGKSGHIGARSPRRSRPPARPRSSCIRPRRATATSAWSPPTTSSSRSRTRASPRRSLTILPLIKRRGAKRDRDHRAAPSRRSRATPTCTWTPRREGSLPAEPRAHREHDRHARARRRARRRGARRARLRPRRLRALHPGGALGRRLLAYVRDVMRKGEQLPSEPPGGSVLPDGAVPDVATSASA